MSKVINFDNTNVDRLRAFEELTESPVGSEVVGQQDSEHYESHYKLVDAEGNVEISMYFDGELAQEPVVRALSDGIEATRSDIEMEEFIKALYAEMSE